MSTGVQDILDQIGRLSDEERCDLTRRLAETEDAEWRREADRARLSARHRGIDQAAVDRAVEGIRGWPDERTDQR